MPVFNSFIAVDLENKQMIQCLDTGGLSFGCNLYIYRNNTQFTFTPENANFIIMNNNSQNIKRIRILDKAIAF